MTQSFSPLYRPILLTKRGELRAVVDLAPDVRASFVPIFVAHPVSMDFDTGSPATTVEAHVAGLGRKIAESFDGPVAHFDPTFLLNDVQAQSPAVHPALVVAQEAQQATGLTLVPVISPGRDAVHVAATAAVHRIDGRGVCVRLTPRDWPPNGFATQQLTGLLTDLGVVPEQVDLVLDLGAGADNELAAGLVMAALPSVPTAGRWRSLTFASAGFSKDLSEFPKNQVSRRPRYDWLLWQDIVDRAHTAGWRIPDFADYVVAHPDPTVDIDPRFLSISASLRYTVAVDWLIAKGELFKGRGGTGQGGDAAIPVARMIANHAEFSGADFSAGDRWIDSVATGTATSGGNPEAWRRAATNHHLTLVSRSLATPSGS